MDKDLKYFDLATFVQLFSTGKFSMVDPIELNNITGEKTFHMSFLRHGMYLSKKYNTNMIDILSTIKHTSKELLLELINSNSYVSNYISHIINEWGYENISAKEILHDGFDSQTKYSVEPTVFDYNSIIDEHKVSNELENELKLIEDIISSNQQQGGGKMIQSVDTSIQNLQDKCTSCTQRITQNLEELTSKNKLIDPVYHKVLLDLSTKHKSQYLGQSHINNDNSTIPDFLTSHSSEHIPDNLHIIFLNYLLLINMIHKEIEYLISSFSSLQNDMKEKETLVGDYLQRITTNTSPLQESSYLDKIKQMFPSFSDSDDEEPQEELSKNDSDSEEEIKIVRDTHSFY